MLNELKVENFAIIENLHICFGKGLNILSGETGAGKSVLFKSLSLLMGGKAASESIRTGCDQALIEGSFDLKQRPDIKKRLHDMGLETDEDLLIVRRIISQNDKSRIYLNNNLSTLSSLRDIVAPLIEVAGHHAPLIEMTGQHDNRHLLSKTYHLDLLDHYAGQWDKRLQYQEKYHHLRGIEKQIHEILSNSQKNAQRLDFLLYQKDEITNLNFNPEEDLELENQIKKFRSASRLLTFVDFSEQTLLGDEDSATARFKAVMKRAQELESIDPKFSSLIQPLQQAYVVIEDSLYDLRKYVSHLEIDPAQLESLENRLSQLRKLQKKYGSIENIQSALEDMESEIQRLQNAEGLLVDLQNQKELLTKELLKLAQDLHQRRKKSAVVMEKSVNGELLDLNMKGVSFHIQIDSLGELSSSGQSEVEFMSQTSPKDPPRPLAKFASGGELSRILLSLKRVVGNSPQPRTYLFDEVDTGVSGPTAEKVGKKLRSIAKGQQVICVTHLPQVAAFGDVHFFIQKSPQRGSVRMEVIELKQPERVKEIARLISGEKISKTSLAHAQELLKEATH